MRHMAVDRYLKTNRRFAENETYPDMTALYRALDYDGYDILYGINDSEYYDKQRSIIKNAAYKEINGKTLTIIYECPCKTTKKDNHHHNYNRPLEVMRLCRSCHTKEHYRLKLSADQSATNSTTPAVQTSVEDRGESSNQFLETEASYRESMPCMDDDRRAASVTDGVGIPRFSISFPRDGRTDTAAIALNR